MVQATLPASLRQLRAIGWCEGTSYLLLLGVAMPLKYLADWPLGVTWVGTAHGALWILYLLAIARCWIQFKWKFRDAFWGGVASVLPFGPFVYDSWIIRREVASSR
ncbi:MAG TPA: DUF3817 domain-containing protein [Fimbriimonadaceae bacterium]|nr:DUF3817 domain-containing protein [Fimbriimonadaceae bacterium]HRJ33175.1 DUF3817 domain-containing protein [Fimbriimonadaceae bacterium]